VTEDRLARAIAAIDAANAGDPHRIEIRGQSRPKELGHAELASEWIERLDDAPSEALQIATRAHHLRRWSLPRNDYPDGRKGYLVWRQALKDRHADETSEILHSIGYPESIIDRVRRIILRKNLVGDPEAQLLEDALCLVFFETQLDELAGRLSAEKMRDVGIKTLRKMTPRARKLALELPMPEAYLRLLDELCEEL
jgi:hypothetical protein